MSRVPAIKRYMPMVRSGRAHKPGHPTVSAAQKRQKARERVRVSRARRRRVITIQPAVGT